MEPNQSLPKREKLKSIKRIGVLFRTGKCIFVFPFKVLYLPTTQPVPYRMQVAFAVPKRSFRKANKRNRIKRLMREAFRISKGIYYSSDATPLEIILIYIAKEELDFLTIQNAMVKLLHQMKRL